MELRFRSKSYGSSDGLQDQDLLPLFLLFIVIIIIISGSLIIILIIIMITFKLLISTKWQHHAKETWGGFLLEWLTRPLHSHQPQTFVFVCSIGSRFTRRQWRGKQRRWSSSPFVIQLSPSFTHRGRQACSLSQTIQLKLSWNTHNFASNDSPFAKDRLQNATNPSGTFLLEEEKWSTYFTAQVVILAH